RPAKPVDSWKKAKLCASSLISQNLHFVRTNRPLPVPWTFPPPLLASEDLDGSIPLPGAVAIFRAGGAGNHRCPPEESADRTTIRRADSAGRTGRLQTLHRAVAGW